MTVYGYLRVSTDKQDCDNQKIGVEELAKKQGVPIESWIIDDGVSGTKEPEKRKLGKLLKRIKSGDVIICSELSRLGRRLFMVISILEHCMKIGAKVLTVKDGYELSDNVQSKVLAFAFGLVAELERDMISKRTKEALAAKKARGEKLGRAFGAKNKIHKFDGFSFEKFEKAYAKTFKVKIACKDCGISATVMYSTPSISTKCKEIIQRLREERYLKNGCQNTPCPKRFSLKCQTALKSMGGMELKPIVRLSDFKVYETIESCWYDNFAGQARATVCNVKKLLKAIEDGDEFHGKFFEFKDFYDGVSIG